MTKAVEILTEYELKLSMRMHVYKVDELTVTEWCDVTGEPITVSWNQDEVSGDFTWGTGGS